MKDNDSLQRFIFEHMPVRGEYLKLEHSYRTIMNQHNYPAPIRRLLGEALCVAGLLSAIIKFEGRLTVQFRGTSGLKLLLAQSDNDFHLRGLAKWEGNLSYEELMASLNDGVLVITLDMGENKNRYQGIVAWRNNLVESIEGYFRDSEQLATRLWMAIDDKQAVGLLMQIVPGSTKDGTIATEESVQTDWNYVNETTKDIQESMLLTNNFPEVVRDLFPEDVKIRVFKPQSVSFQCTCSRKNGADAIMILGRKEAEEELKNHNTIVVTCDFCNREYIFDRNDVNHIFENQTKPKSQLH